MKKALIFLLILITAALAVGCSQQTDSPKADEPTAAPSTQLHTLPPADVEREPEWAPVDCEISLDSSDAVYAENSDFLTFALIGSSDEDCALRFKLNDETAAMLKKESAGVDFYLVVNGKTLKGAVTFNDDFTEMTVTGGCSYTEMCALATEIRGL